MSGLAPLRGHVGVRSALAGALQRGELPAALLFIGPAGVGKQRTALWLAQLLLCERPAGPGPCDGCRACRMALRIEHPDLHWFFPLPRPKGAAGTDRLAEALEEARAAELETRRADPYYAALPNEPVGIYLAHAQVMRRIALSRPAMGSRKIIIIGNADLLVPQEASPEAANALLKLLEEPPPATTIVATTSDPESLLPTVRSRLLPVRFRRLAQEEVATFLVQVKQAAPDRARSIARLAEGSIGRAIGFLPVDGEPGTLDALRLRARHILEASLAGDAQIHEVALGQAPTGARGDFATVLEFLLVWLRDLGAVAAGAPESVVNIDALDWLTESAARHPAAGPGSALAIDDVASVLGLTSFNINPQLALDRVMRTLAGRLTGSAGPLVSAPARA